MICNTDYSQSISDQDMQNTPKTELRESPTSKQKHREKMQKSVLKGGHENRQKS